MKIDLSQFRQTFLQESADHLVSMEAGLLALRSDAANVELLNSIFRSAHSMKGGAGSFGMSNLVRFTHSLENLLDRLRSLEIRATDEVIDTLLQSVDVLQVLLAADANADMPADALKLDACIERLMSGSEAGVADAPLANAAPAETPGKELKLYKIDFLPDRELFSSGTNPIVLLRNLASLGTVSCCHLHDEKLPPIIELDPSHCYLSWTVEMASLCAEEELREVFEFVEHLAEIRIECLDAPLASRTAMPAADVHAVTTKRAPAASPTTAPKTESAAPPPRQAVKKTAAGGESSSIRVSIDKVDRLIDLVGELVIAHVMTAQMVEDFEPSCLPKLREAVASMERNTRELHERVMAVRMLPVGTLFQRYTRTVYDIAQSTGKELRLETDGEETEIDKSMLELLADPLTHLVRNAADHGVELPAVRLAAGKPEEGVIKLRAFHRSGRIAIEISDDGAGVDTQAVRRKALERGLIGADTQMSDDQLRMLIFEPGFSTRDAISDLSGRGVGMDVVKRNVQQLNGTVTLASEIGRGSTVSIELPLTLAILEGLLVRVGDRTLVLPLLSVIETVPLRDEQIVRVAEQGEVVLIRGVSVPLLRLSKYLGLVQTNADPETQAGSPMHADAQMYTDAQALAAEAAHRRLAVIVEAGNRKVGLVVDELLGQQQVVVKSLERHLHKVDGLMGATILGDGCVAPIVDVAGIASMNLFALQSKTNISPHIAASARNYQPDSLKATPSGGSSNALV